MLNWKKFHRHSALLHPIRSSRYQFGSKLWYSHQWAAISEINLARTWISISLSNLWIEFQKASRSCIKQSTASLPLDCASISRESPWHHEGYARSIAACRYPPGWSMVTGLSRLLTGSYWPWQVSEYRRWLPQYMPNHLAGTGLSMSNPFIKDKVAWPVHWWICGWSFRICQFACTSGSHAHRPCRYQYRCRRLWLSER